MSNTQPASETSDGGVPLASPEEAKAIEAYGKLKNLVDPYIASYVDAGLPTELLDGADLEFEEHPAGNDSPGVVHVRIGAVSLAPKDEQMVFYVFDQGKGMGYDVQPTQVTPPPTPDSIGQVAGRPYDDKRFEEIDSMIASIGAHGTQFKGVKLAPRIKISK